VSGRFRLKGVLFSGHPDEDLYFLDILEACLFFLFFSQLQEVIMYVYYRLDDYLLFVFSLCSYEKDISTLTERFQSELKAAFGGDTGSMDMLNRLQDLEIAIEETRKDREQKIKEITELCEKEKQQMKDDMATVLQVRSIYRLFLLLVVLFFRFP